MLHEQEDRKLCREQNSDKGRQNLEKKVAEVEDVNN